MRKRLLTALKFAVSIGILVWLATKVDVRELLAQAKEMKPAWFVLSVLAGFATMSVCAFRWWRINRFVKISLPFGFCQLAYLEAITISLLLPGSTAGDVVRAVRVGRHSGDYRGAIAATVFDRIGNLGAMMIFGTVLLPYFLFERDLDQLAMIVAAVVAAGIIATCIVFFIPFSASVRRHRWIREILKFVLKFRRAFGTWRKAGELTALSMLGLMGTASMLYFAMLSAGVADLRFIEIASAAILGIVVSALPVTIAGLGLREGAVIWALLQFDFDRGEAYLAAFAFGASIMLQSIPGLVIWLTGALDRKDVTATLEA